MNRKGEEVNTCDREQLLLLAADELDAQAAAAMKAHLASCPRCAEELEHLREGLALVARLPDAEPSGAAVERIRTAAAKALAGRRRLRRPSFVYRYRYALAAAAMLMAVIGWSIIQDMTGEPVTSRATRVADQTLEEKWLETMSEVTDSTALMDDLDALQENDPWAKLASAVDADTGDQFQEILDYLDMIEAELTNGS